MKAYVKVRVSGKSVRLFIKRIYQMNIYYTEYKQINKNCIEFKIKYEDYEKINKKNTIYDVQIIRKYGYIKLMNYVLNNITIVISFLISIVLVFVMSKLIFSVNVIHNSKNIRDIIKEELDNYNIKKFRFIPSYDDIENIKNRILAKHKDEIKWLEIAVNGNKISVKIIEKKKDINVKVANSRDIVAKKDGIIKRIEATSGEIIKKKNDYVNRGDIIVSGSIMKDDTVKEKVVAKGRVYAEVWYLVSVTYPLYYEEIIYLDEVKTNYVLSFLSNKYSLRNNLSSFQVSNKVNIASNNMTPFNIYKEKQRKVKVNKQKLSMNQAKEKAVTKANDKIKGILNDDEYIIDKKVLNFYKKDSKIIIEVFFKVYENITEYKTLEE